MVKNEHCCEWMAFFLEEGKVAIGYNIVLREYFIMLKNGNIDIVQKIQYCPWCSVKFIKDLRKEWFEVLEVEYGIEDPFCNDEKRIPEEFRTDTWWRKRGL